MKIENYHWIMSQGDFGIFLWDTLCNLHNQKYKNSSAVTRHFASLEILLSPFGSCPMAHWQYINLKCHIFFFFFAEVFPKEFTINIFLFSMRNKGMWMICVDFEGEFQGDDFFLNFYGKLEFLPLNILNMNSNFKCILYVNLEFGQKSYSVITWACSKFKAYKFKFLKKICICFWTKLNKYQTELNLMQITSEITGSLSNWASSSVFRSYPYFHLHFTSCLFT